MKDCKLNWGNIGLLNDEEFGTFFEHALVCEYHDKILTGYENSFKPILSLAFDERKTIELHTSNFQDRNYQNYSSVSFIKNIHFGVMSVSRMFINTANLLVIAICLGFIAYTIFLGPIENKAAAKANEEPPVFRLLLFDSEESDLIEEKLKHIEITAEPEYLPKKWALKGTVIDEYGYSKTQYKIQQSYSYNGGINISGNFGDPVIASASGKVVKVVEIIEDKTNSPLGKYIEIYHGNGLSTRYTRLSEIKVLEGDIVRQGSVIGLVSSTKQSTESYLHFEIWYRNMPINPLRFLSDLRN